MRKFILPILAAIAFLPAENRLSNAVSLCNCCAEQHSDQCNAICAAAKSAPGQCSALVDYAPSTKRPKINPLNGTSLKEISLGDPSPSDLENWRKFLEKYRRIAVRDYNRAAEKYRKGHLDDASMSTAKKLLGEAMVNYNHGIRAYQVAIGRKPE